MRSLIYLCLLCLCSYAQAQVDTLSIAPLDSLEASLKFAYNTEWTAKRQEFSYKLKGAWTKAVPTVGLTFGLPSVSWSPNQVFETGNQKRLLRAKLQSIDLDYAHKLNKAVSDLRIEYKKIKLQAESIKQESELLAIKADIFAIAEKQNKANEILPADYLSKKLAFEESRANLFRQKNLLQIAVLELYKAVSYNLPNVPIYYEVAPDCILLER